MVRKEKAQTRVEQWQNYSRAIVRGGVGREVLIRFLACFQKSWNRVSRHWTKRARM
jgi:hypothetical protein